MIIDAHAHLAGAVYQGDAANGLAGLLAAMDAAGIDASCVMSLGPEDNAAVLAGRLRAHNILVRPLNDARLGPGYMRVTTALPEGNARVVAALETLL